jgi:hypothetical protein
MDRGEGCDAVFVATSVTWCENEQLLVRLLFEGATDMRSQLGKETEVFVNSAGFTCQSVDDDAQQAEGQGTRRSRSWST